MRGGGQVDLCMHHRLLMKRSEEQRRDLLLIQSGALWTASAMAKAGYLEGDECPWCHKQAEDLGHLFWTCSQHEHCRSKVRQLGIDGTQLPRILGLHGIPVEPAGDLDAAIWREEDRPQDAPAAWTPPLQGDDTISWACAHEELTAEIAREGGQHQLETRTARQVGEWIQGGFQQLPTWEQLPIYGARPADINVYLDGGVELGQKTWTSIGAWGMYVPQGTTVQMCKQMQQDTHLANKEMGA